MGYSTKFDYKSLGYFLKPYPLGLSLLAGLALTKGLLELFNVHLIFLILQWGLSASPAIPSPLIHVVNQLNQKLPFDPFISSCIFFLCTSVLLGAVEVISLVYRSRLVTRIVYRAQSNLYSLYLREGYEKLLHSKQGDMIYTLVMPPNNLQTLFITATTLFTDTVIFAALFGSILFLSLKAAFLITVLGVVYYLFAHYVSGAILFRSSAAQQLIEQRMSVHMNETFNGIRLIKGSRMEAVWIEQFKQLVRGRLANYQKRMIWKRVPAILLTIVPAVILSLVGMTLKYSQPQLFLASLPVFGAIGFAVYRVMPHIMSLMTIKMDIVSVLPSMDLLHQKLQRVPPVVPQGHHVFTRFSEPIVFENVAFHFEGQPSLMENVSFALQPHQTTALVGASGTGKSTLVNLLLRLYEPSAGLIRVNGIPLKDYTLDSWLSKIGLVAQEPFVVHGTIRENIFFGLTSPLLAFEKACQQAGVEEFVQRLPQGYDTVVGDQGLRLSGGERQRLCIARALLRDPEFLILDEATSSLDNRSEALIQGALERIRKERTILMIAHRLSTVVNADTIVVMGRGGVLESGKHQELMDRRGPYWQLYTAQTRTHEPSTDTPRPSVAG